MKKFALIRSGAYLLAAVAIPSLAAAQAQVQLSFLGNAGWEITDGKTVILVDPYLTRLKMEIPGASVSADDPRQTVPMDGIAASDTSVIDAHIKRADFILLTHTHIDHALDMPYIAHKTGALVIGTESTTNLGHDSGLPDSQLFTVKGGEDLDFKVFSVQVIPSLHTIMRQAANIANFPMPPPSTIFPRDAKPPFRVRDLLIEGGTLAYLIRLNGVRILVFGSMNYIEREVAGLAPDVAIIGAGRRDQIYEYFPHLLRAIDYPPTVLPTHWDRFNLPYGASQQPALDRMQVFVREVKAASPNTQVIVPEYFQPISVKPRGDTAKQKEPQ